MSSYRLYVIPLNSTVTQTKKFKKQNPDFKSGKCFYVGQTAKEPEVRLQEHLSGKKYRHSPTVKNYGERQLRPDLAPKKTYPTRNSAIRAERRLAKRLAKKGFGVICG